MSAVRSPGSPSGAARHTRARRSPALRRVAVAVALAVTPALAVGTDARADGLPCDQYDPTCTNTLPRSSFYAAPSPLPPGPAGQLLRSAPADATYHLPAGVRAWLILYRSRGAEGRSVAVSGVVLTPPGRPPGGGWPVVAYAHGTSGVARDCAPSLMGDLYHGSQLAAMVQAGFAVVATDYAGLGGPGHHELLDKDVQARNVVDALPAARRAVPDLSRQWVAYGHSQGGTAALGVAELMRTDRDRGYLGTVATSPASDLAEVLEHTAADPYAAGFVPLVVAGARAADHHLAVDQILTTAAAQRFPLVEHACLNAVIGAYADLTGDALVRPGFTTERHLAAYLRASEPDAAVRGPLFIAQGSADTLIPAPVTDALVARSCGRGVDVEYRRYPGLTHDTVGGSVGIDDGAMPDIIGWIGARFAGAPTSPTCA